MPSFFFSLPASSARSTRLPLLGPYTTHSSPTLLFLNSHAKGNYFLPSSIQQLLLLLDSSLLLALPFYAIGVTYYWSYHQSAAADSGGDALSALFSSMCGVLHFTLFIVYIIVLLSLLSVRDDHTLSSHCQPSMSFDGRLTLSPLLLAWCTASSLPRADSSGGCVHSRIHLPRLRRCPHHGVGQ